MLHNALVSISNGLLKLDLRSPSIAGSLARSLARSSLARSLDRSVPPSLGRSNARSVGRSVARSLVRSFGRSVARSLARSLDRSIARSLGRLVDRFDGVSPQKLCSVGSVQESTSGGDLGPTRFGNQRVDNEACNENNSSTMFRFGIEQLSGHQVSSPLCGLLLQVRYHRQ